VLVKGPGKLFYYTCFALIPTAFVGEKPKASMVFQKKKKAF
jgi:hypothetical protein